MLKKRRLITSALPYVNNIPHLGNIIGCVLSADVFARYCKMAGYETLYISGNDEYGTTTETRALQEGVTAKELCDKYHAIHKEIYDWFNIDFSYFGRTSSDKQTEIVQGIFWDLYNNGYITEDTVTQPFCEKCSLPLADRYIEGTCPHCGYEQAKGDQCDKCGKLLEPTELKSPKCTICGSTPIFRESKHLFLDLQTLRPTLEKWVTETAEKNHWSNNALSITKGWIEQGLQKRCITRDLKWGVPVPLDGYQGKVFYVWFDAPIGYMSITANMLENWQDWWQDPDNVDLYQFMGKDNIPFHTVLFPASLLGSKKKWTLLKTISSTEYLNYEDQKFSKSRGTGVFGNQAKDTGIDADLFRYYLLRNRPEKSDTQFFWNDFMEKANGEIIANYANLVNRVFQFIDRFFDGVVPEFDASSANSVFSEINLLTKKEEIIKSFEAIELKDTLLDILSISSVGNKFFQDNAPWNSVKTDINIAKTVIGSLACFIKDVSILLYPFIPNTIKNVFNTLNMTESDIILDNIGNYNKILGKKINKPEILFNKLEKKQIEELKEKFAGKNQTKSDKKCNKQAKNVCSEQNNANADDFARIMLKVGKIIDIKRHPKADKLYIEQIDLGNGDVRQIVSGIVPYYKEDELLNKNVIVVANLKPAILRGEKSSGMILAAENAEKTTVEVLFPTADIGQIVNVDGIAPLYKDDQNNVKEITIDDFFKVQLTVSSKIVKYSDKSLKIGGNEIHLAKVDCGTVR